jgi:Zn finger protein HypA/HybF involved in hydrogenase expression
MEEAIEFLMANANKCMECKVPLRGDTTHTYCTRCIAMYTVDELKFIVIMEQNMKDNELFVHYCQWNGNEYELTKLVRHIEAADREEYPVEGDVSRFAACLVKITEESVDQHVKLPFGRCDHMFQKHVGTFTCPECIITTRDLDEHFYGGQLKKFFT